MRTKSIWFLAILLVAAVVANGVAMARGDKPAQATAAGAPLPPIGIGTERVTSTKTTVTVTGVAASRGLERERTKWFSALVGVARAQETGATLLIRRTVNPSGRLIGRTRDDVDPVGSDANVPVVRTAEQIAADVQARAASMGATIVKVNYAPLFGGVAEVVVQPKNPVRFANHACTKISPLLGLTPNQPYMLTVVDSHRVPIFFLSWTPHLGGGIGQGTGWQAPGVHSCALWDGPLVDRTR